MTDVGSAWDGEIAVTARRNDVAVYFGRTWIASFLAMTGLGAAITAVWNHVIVEEKWFYN